VQFLETTSETLPEISKVQSQQEETLRELAAGQSEIKAAVTQRN
jgi:hypothetical protein